MLQSVVVRDPCVIINLEARVSAGFPSPAADYVEGRIDLNEVLVPHPSATFTMRISGHCLQRAGIHDGDLALVDRSLKAKPGDVVVAVLDGDLTAKRLRLSAAQVWLDPDTDDPTYRPIEVTGNPSFEIWGVVYATIRMHRQA